MVEAAAHQAAHVAISQGGPAGQACGQGVGGGIQLGVRRLGETAAQHMLRFEVRDTGIGLSAEQSRQLFESFQQADSSTTRHRQNQTRQV